jgi:hypothetical protein
MSGLTMWTAAFLLSVDIGWRPYPGGGLEYIIQIEPHMLDSLKEGEDIQSVIPPNLGRVRAVRIAVGSAAVPRDAAAEETISNAASPSPLGSEPSRSPPFSPFDQDDSPPNPAETRPEEEQQLPLLNLPPPTGANGRPRTSGESFGGFGGANGDFGSLRSEDYSNPLGTRAADLEREGSEPPSATFSSEDPGGGSAAEEPQRLPNQSRQAVYIEEEGPSANTMLKPQLTEEVEPAADKPWLPFTLCLAALFGSLGGMLYFGWVAWDYRVRYRTLLERLIQTGRDYDSVGSSPGFVNDRATETRSDRLDPGGLGR